MQWNFDYLYPKRSSVQRFRTHKAFALSPNYWNKKCEQINLGAKEQRFC